MTAPEEDLPGAALAWLEPRLEEVPEELAEAVRGCVRRAGEEDLSASGAGSGEPATVSGFLAEAAARELERILDLPQDRATAIRLLAVDASLTYAFESAADRGEDVSALSERYGLRGRFGDLLARVRAGGEEREP